MKRTFFNLLLGVGLVSFLGTSAIADHHKTTIKGQGMCAKCELGKTDSCQNVIQAVYFLEETDATKGFHKNVCQKVIEKATAVGTVKEKDGQLYVNASKLEAGAGKSFKVEGKEKLVRGEGLCAKCELGKTDSCQNAIRVTYFVESDENKAFHKNVCQSVKPVKAKGEIKEKDGKTVLVADTLELDN